MLVLSRRRFESLEVDGPCKIKVVEIQRGQVKLAIEAEQHVNIRRCELPRPEESEATDSL